MATIRPAPITPHAHSNQQAAGSKPRVTSRNSDLSNSTLDGADKNLSTDERPKKTPPSKAQVGLAKGPDIKNCKSKIGSLNNIKHTPSGGAVVIPTQKLKWEAKSKIGSLENKEHKPGGGKLKVESRKLEWSTTSKVQSLKNINHKPGGGKVKIFNESYVDKSQLRRNMNAFSPTQSSEHGDSEADPKTACSQEQFSKTRTNATRRSEDEEPVIKGVKNLSIKD